MKDDGYGAFTYVSLLASGLVLPGKGALLFVPGRNLTH
ncbi:putative membrane protein [Serratia plymuthica A30]|nr:putative membrane protein [Serratia plymuthica A30]